MSVAFSFAIAAPIGSTLDPAPVDHDCEDACHRGDRFHLMTETFQQANRIWGEARLDSDLVRLPLVMKTRTVNRILNVHPKIEHVEHHLQHGRDDAPATRTSDD